MDDTMIKIAGLILGSSLVTTVFGKLFDFFASKNKINQILLLGAIENLCDKIIAQGHRSKIQTLRLQEAYAEYKKRGGDGYADAMITDAMAKPLKEAA